MRHLWISVICCLFLSENCRGQTTNLTFPVNFTIGASTSSYQIEGAWNTSDKGENVWDSWTHNYPEYIEDGSNGDIACDSYNKYLEDVQWIKDLGLDYYRFSISWSRILPNGFANQVSEVGIQYYKNLIQALLDNDIEPMVTIYHWDHPQVLEELGGWTNELMVDWFSDYARIIFEELGPMVKTFNTINEPKILCDGYNGTRKAPGKMLENMGHYICVHNTLKAHAKTYHIYDEEYRPTQQGQIGIVQPCSGWVLTENTTDALIDQYFQFDCGWILHPIFIGDYPEIMKTRIAMISELEGYPFSRLPEFSQEWIEYINGTSDFVGLNHYTSSILNYDPDEDLGIYTVDSGVLTSSNSSWTSASDTSWIYILPEGFRNLLGKLRDEYNNAPIYILENGIADDGALEDHIRMNYFYAYVSAVLSSIYEDGCNIVRYTIWSLLDNFEWSSGYTERFGIISVDFNSANRTRREKLSTVWWKEVLSTRTLQSVPTSNSTR